MIKPKITILILHCMILAFTVHAVRPLFVKAGKVGIASVQQSWRQNTIVSFKPDSTSTFTVLDGYTDRNSYNPGDTVNVFINAPAVIRNRTIYLYSINDEKVDSVKANVFPQTVMMHHPWENGFDYHVTFSYKVPSLKSGVYYWDNSRRIFFIVKSAAKNLDFTIIYPTNTEAAYNNSGGKSLYDFNSGGNNPLDTTRSFAVSFQRPLNDWMIQNMRTYCEAYLQWINKQDYNIQMISDLDMDDYSEIENSKVLIVVGHSEYWSRKARLNFDRFVNTGKDAIILSGNTMWWQVRYSDDHKKLICYKDFRKDTIQNVHLKTINWPEYILGYPVLNSIGADFNHGAYGNKPYHGWFGYKVVNPGSPLLEGTNMLAGDVISCQSEEYDGTLAVDTTGKNFVLDSVSLGFCKIELVGYDWGKSITRYGPPKSYGTFIVFRKTPFSGTVINTCFSHWCSKNGQGGSLGGFGGPGVEIIKRISLNMMNKLLSGESVFSTPSLPCYLSVPETTIAPGQTVNVYPNPSTGRFSVDIKSDNDIIKIEIFNQLGGCISSSNTAQAHHEVDLEMQPKGIYFLKSTLGDKVVTRKIVIQ